MAQVIHRCPFKCPIGKKCFILKTATAIKKPLVVLFKCEAQKGKDRKIVIGGNERPP